MTKLLTTKLLTTDMTTLLPALDAEPPAMPGDTAGEWPADIRPASAGAQFSAGETAGPAVIRQINRLPCLANICTE
jgi:hypothetical protein